jgi:hypothetical protein
MIYAIVLLAVLARISIVIVLIWRYLRTREVGLLWLGAGLVLWPTISSLLGLGGHDLIDRWHGQLPSLIERVHLSTGDLVMAATFSEQFIGSCLLLVAILYLSRTKGQAPATQA